MASKKIVVYFRKKIGGNDPFAKWGAKRSVYHSLFRMGESLGFEMYFIPQPEHYLGGVLFQNPWKYSSAEGTFHPTHETITADAIYDRSGGLSFPDRGIDAKVLNSRAFKALCADKNRTYDLLKEFMPPSFRIKTQKELSIALIKFSSQELVVLKPADGFGGKDIAIDTPLKIQGVPLKPKKAYTLQKFVDTSSGIPGITDTLHDLRIIIVDGEVVLAHVRTPKKDSLLANVAQGGSIREVPLKKIPPFIMRRVQKIQRIIDRTFNRPIYSIDFGISGESAYVFELNDQIGFPSEDMHASTKFINNILRSLSRRADI